MMVYKNYTCKLVMGELEFQTPFGRAYNFAELAKDGAILEGIINIREELTDISKVVAIFSFKESPNAIPAKG